ncbi:MAG TPA: YCF48-related protein [Bryobacteraceae bacterium]|nr:YCF48-related protein [Bryobacteraceae bacterium]
MPAVSRTFAITLGLFALLPALGAAQRWKMQYLYDESGSNFDIRDIACPSAQRCVAAGVITDKKDREQGAVVVTSDGGSHWSLYQVKEQPLSVFFLNDTLGWMVTDRGLWSTQEGGRSWTKVDNRKGILQVHFLDAKHGIIGGISSLLEQTADGGKTWTEVPGATSEQVEPRAVSYDSLAFLGQHGIIVGEVDPDVRVHRFLNRSAGEHEPEEPQRRAIILETMDGGKKWLNGTLGLDADLGRLRISKQGAALALVVYRDAKSPIASAVFETTLGKPDTRMIFGERDRTPTDVAVLDDGSGILAAVEPPGNSPQVPIPGKLKIFESRNLKLWKEMDVDYRAVAQAAVIAVADPSHIWVATDTGAILGLDNGG